MMQKETENLKFSKKKAEEDLKAEKMWSKEKESEVERLEAEVKGRMEGIASNLTTWNRRSGF